MKILATILTLVFLCSTVQGCPFIKQLNTTIKNLNQALENSVLTDCCKDCADTAIATKLPDVSLSNDSLFKGLDALAREAFGESISQSTAALYGSQSEYLVFTAHSLLAHLTAAHTFGPKKFLLEPEFRPHLTTIATVMQFAQKCTTQLEKLQKEDIPFLPWQHPDFTAQCTKNRKKSDSDDVK